jgi:hypothetical protein
MSGVGLNHFLIIVKCTRITTEVALHPNASNFIILLYLMPDFPAGSGLYLFWELEGEETSA